MISILSSLFAVCCLLSVRLILCRELNLALTLMLLAEVGVGRFTEDSLRVFKKPGRFYLMTYPNRLMWLNPNLSWLTRGVMI